MKAKKVRSKAGGKKAVRGCRALALIGASTPCPVEVEPGRPCGELACREHGGYTSVTELVRGQTRTVAEPYYPRGLWALVRSATAAGEADNLDLEAAYLRKLVDVVATLPTQSPMDQVQVMRQLLAEVRETVTASAKLKVENEGMMSAAEIQSLLEFVIRTIRVYLPDPMLQQRFAQDIRSYMTRGKEIVRRVAGKQEEEGA
jgi:hypothetical protein